jgi:hypothetical protein
MVANSVGSELSLRSEDLLLEAKEPDPSVVVKTQSDLSEVHRADVFISHSSMDKNLVRHLDAVLKTRSQFLSKTDEGPRHRPRLARGAHSPTHVGY